MLEAASVEVGLPSMLTDLSNLRTRLISKGPR